MVGCGRAGGEYQEIEVRAQASAAISTLPSHPFECSQCRCTGLPSNATTSWSKIFFNVIWTYLTAQQGNIQLSWGSTGQA